MGCMKAALQLSVHLRGRGRSREIARDPDVEKRDSSAVGRVPIRKVGSAVAAEDTSVPRHSVAVLGSQEWPKTVTVGPSIGRDSAGAHFGMPGAFGTVWRVQVGV